jgi:RNA polymerase sigma-70 factor (ECF subfamily)
MKAEAEDITHQVFMSAWKNIKKYQFQGYPFSSWLYKIARNEVIDFWRTKKNNVPIHEVHEETIGESDNTEIHIDMKMDSELVALCIKRLDPHYQDVLILKFVEELTNEEIANSMGKTEGSIRVIQHRAIKKLKQEIEHERAHH